MYTLIEPSLKGEELSPTLDVLKGKLNKAICVHDVSNN